MTLLVKRQRLNGGWYILWRFILSGYCLNIVACTIIAFITKKCARVDAELVICSFGYS